MREDGFSILEIDINQLKSFDRYRSFIEQNNDKKTSIILMEFMI